ncbi:hypothetical protein D1872_270920 [compost metagenome]
MKVAVFVDKNRDIHAGLNEVGQKGGADPFANLPPMLIPQCGDRNMHLFRMRLRAGGDGIKPGLQRLEQSG